MMKIFIFAAAMSLCVPAAFALEPGTELDLTENLRARVLSVNGHNHEVAVFANPDNRPVGNLEIQNTYFKGEDYFTVTTIAADGFKTCELTSVIMPRELSTISINAFYGCTRLKSVTEAVPGSIKTIGDYAFYYTSRLESVDFPGVESVGQFCFWVSSVESVSMPSVERLGGGAFYECQKLKTFIGGEKLESVGNIAFCRDAALEALTLGPGLKEVGNMAFAFNENMPEIVVPSALESAGSNAFQGSGYETMFLLSDKLMDFCADSKVLAHSALKDIYCVSTILEDVRAYVAGQVAAGEITAPASADIHPMTDIVNMEYSGDAFRPIFKIDGITDFKVYDTETGLEIEETDGVYDIPADKVRLVYRINSVNLLDYAETLSRETTGINAAGFEVETTVEYYGIDGTKLANPAPGINICRSSDGSSRVIIMR